MAASPPPDGTKHTSHPPCLALLSGCGPMSMLVLVVSSQPQVSQVFLTAAHCIVLESLQHLCEALASTKVHNTVCSGYDIL